MSGQLRLFGRSAEERLERLEAELERQEARWGPLVARCGEAAHLVPDTLLLANSLLYHHPARRQGYITGWELDDAADSLVREPLLSALQDGRPSSGCRHCGTAEPLRVIAVNRSGSSAEGLEDLIIGKGGPSDFDIMLELGGPLRWAAPALTEEEPSPISPSRPRSSGPSPPAGRAS